MALGEQVFGFYIPTVTLMGIGAHKELGKTIKTLKAKKTADRYGQGHYKGRANREDQGDDQQGCGGRRACL